MEVNDIIVSAGIIGKVTEIKGTKVKFVSGLGWNCTAEIDFCKLADENDKKRYENKKTGM
jgi:preprotein translocase subunit YajC